MHKCHANASNSSDLQLSHLLDPHIHGLCTAPARTTRQRQTHRSRRTAGMQARIARSPSPAHPILSYPAGTGPSTVPWFPNPSPPAPAAQGRVNASCSLVNGHGVTPALDPLLSPSIPSSSNTGAVAFALCDCAETVANGLCMPWRIACRARAQGMSIEGGGRFWKAMAECGARERGDIF